jgi:hypothetical protein
MNPNPKGTAKGIGKQYEVGNPCHLPRLDLPLISPETQVMDSSGTSDAS